jgi:hypothetical protein
MESFFMKAIAVTGFACPAQKWKEFLRPLGNVPVTSFRELLENAENPRDLRSLGRYVGTQIDLLKPELLIAHDFGVPILIMGLMRVRRKNPDYRPRVLLFNSALRGLNLLKTTHPMRIQIKNWKQITALVEEGGGDCDPGLEKFLPQIKAIYRQVIAKALLDQAQSLMGKTRAAQLDLGKSVLVFRSNTDPYFSGETVQKMADDIAGSQVVKLDYGHFPYSLPFARYEEEIRKWLAESGS